MTQVQPKKSTRKNENGLINIIVNVILPVFILNKGTKIIGPLPALFVALAFPIGYGIWHGVKQKKWSAMSVLGLLNVTISGGLAVAGLGGIWFAIKEAAFPFLIGVFVVFSTMTKKPFIETLFFNENVMNVPLIEEKLKEHRSHALFHRHLRQSTQLLSLSFFLSAGLNYWLASRIFLPLDANLDSDKKAILLNEQIANMTGQSFAVIFVPSMLTMIAILIYLLQGIKKHTGLSQSEILKG